MATAFVALGSNLGDRRHHLKQALKELGDLPQTDLSLVSSWRETLPVGGPPQGVYLNGVARIETELSPEALLLCFQEIERRLGRPMNHEKWGARAIDLDLISYNQVVLKTEILTIPHPLLQKRRFVLEPLLEIAPDWVHPQSGKNAQALLEELSCADH